MFIAEAYSVACDCIGGSFNYLGYEVGDQLQSSKTYN